MPDLRKRFRSADRIPAPDLWPSILDREPTRRPPRPSWPHNLTGVVAVLAVAVLVALLVRLLPLGTTPASTPTRTPRPPAPTLSGSLSPTPSITPGSGVPKAVSQVGTVSIESNLMAAFGGRLYAITKQTGAHLTAVSIDSDGTMTTHVVQTPIAGYFDSITAGSDGVYLGTRVIRRFTDARDELLRLDPATLAVKATAQLTANVDGVVADGNDLWVATGNRVLLMDPVTLAVRASHTFVGLRTPPLGSESISSPAVTEEGVWVLVGDRTNLRLIRLDPHSLAVSSTASLAQLQNQELLHIAAAPHRRRIRWVWLVGTDSIQKVNPLTGQLEVGGLIRMGQIEGRAEPYGGGLVAMITGGTDPAKAGSIVQVDGQGEVVAETDGLGDISNLTVDEADQSDVWMLQGLRLLHVRLVGPQPDCLCG